MGAADKTVIALAAAAAAGENLVGGKAAVLGRLMQAGWTVPTGFVITTEAYARFLAARDLEAMIRIWRRSTESERVLLVEDYFKAVGCFTATRLWAAQGRPRPTADKYAGYGLAADPIYAVFAEKKGGPAGNRPRRTPSVMAEVARQLDAATVARRKRDLARTLRCPHCGVPLAKWAVPQTPFTQYDLEHLHAMLQRPVPVPPERLGGDDESGQPGLLPPVHVHAGAGRMRQLAGAEPERAAREHRRRIDAVRAGKETAACRSGRTSAGRGSS